MTETIHVYPTEESRLHTLDGDRGEAGMCDCCPDYEFEGDGVVVVHQPFEEYVSLH